MLVFTVPSFVEKWIGEFAELFVGWFGREFKYHLVDWNTVCSPVYCGGLGVRKLSTLNHALLGKWLCHFAEKDTHLWRQVVALKHEVG